VLHKRYAYFLSLILPFYESHAGDPFDFNTRRRDKPSSTIVHLKFDVMRGGPPPISILQEETPPPPPFLSFSMPGGIRPALPLTMISTL